jgi:hypothetical protein
MLDTINCLWPATCAACGMRLVPPGDGILRQDGGGNWIALCRNSVACSRRLLARIDPAMLAMMQAPLPVPPADRPPTYLMISPPSTAST